MTGPSSTPRGERAGRPGATWEQQLVRTETVIYDPDDTSGQVQNQPSAPPNRATRRAMQRKARRNP